MYRDIVKYLKFDDIMNLVQAFDLYDVPYSYKKIQLENAGQLRFLNRYPNHFHYDELYLRTVYMQMQKLSLKQSLKTLRVMKSLLGPGIPHIETYDNLQELAINRSNVYRMANLSHLRNLRKLDLSENMISVMKGLDSLYKLESMDLSLNTIKKIENLQDLRSLKLLDLSYNHIVKMENLENLVELKYLSIASNSVKKIENVENLKNLKILDLTFNRVVASVPVVGLSADVALYVNRPNRNPFEDLHV